MSLAIIKRGKLFRYLFKKNELKNLGYKYIIDNMKVKNKIRCLLFLEKIKKVRNSSRTKIVNFCVLSDNPR